ncbi:MAG: hypothetical protein RQ729_02825 [Wenzhouxiangellaceae bacterium]|nr:hypothetical protein [Wenzhouxiangellaceae bacterium]
MMLRPLSSACRQRHPNEIDVVERFLALPGRPHHRLGPNRSEDGQGDILRISIQ